MFNTWGGIVPRIKYLILAVLVVAMGGVSLLGSTVGAQFGQGGFEDPGSEWATAERLEVEAYGRDALSDVVVMYHAPEGASVDDPGFLSRMQQNLDSIESRFPDEVSGVLSYAENRTPALANSEAGVAVASIQLHGVEEEILENYRVIEHEIPIEGIETEIAGLQPVAGALDQGMSDDLVRAELIALPVVFVLLVVIFGGLVAALLPVLVGVLTILGSLGGLHLLAHLVAVNSFAENVITLLGLGLAIDYGLLVVSRFREEIAEGYPPDVAVRRTVATAGRTVCFSALMVAVTLSGLFMFPQDFLRSIAIGAIAAVALAAVLSVTLLPAVLAILGHRVDMLGLKRFQRHRTRAEVERGWFGRIAEFSMRKPVALAVPIVLVLIALILPFSNVQLGGMNETHLPPDDPTRVSQEHYDELFPDQRTDPIKLVVTGTDSRSLTAIRNGANEAPGLASTFEFARSGNTDESGDTVVVLQASLVDRDDAGETIDYLRSFPIPADTNVYVSGNPVMEQDSVDALFAGLPWFVLYVFLATTVLLFLAFGSLVLPFKAALMNVLGLGATLGILTWIFVDGNGAGLANFTPGPLTSPVVVLLVAILYGLSADYEVFLVARMVEARAHGASTRDAIRSGVANTGRIITCAALVLIVVTGAFAFSDIVMMKYIAFGMIAGLIIDATVLRMFLVPAIMQLLGDDCWWAPQWMKRIQRKIGLQEAELAEEDHLKVGTEDRELVGAGAGTAAAAGATAAGGGALGALGAAAGKLRSRTGAAEPDTAPSTDHSQAGAAPGTAGGFSEWETSQMSPVVVDGESTGRGPGSDTDAGAGADRESSALEPTGYEYLHEAGNLDEADYDEESWTGRSRSGDTWGGRPWGVESWISESWSGESAGGYSDPGRGTTGADDSGAPESGGEGENGRESAADMIARLRREMDGRNS